MANQQIDYETGKIAELNSELASQVLGKVYNLNLDKEDLLRKKAEEYYNSVYLTTDLESAMALQSKLLALKTQIEDIK